jgi:hypothetical protein
MTTTKEHFWTIVKYIWISFITWWISHWFFSGTRSIITSLLWVILFIIWNIILSKNESVASILYYCWLAIWIGSLTGGIQHFPDSPERSLIITPLWLFISCIFFTLSENKQFSKSYWVYTTIGTIIVTILSVMAFFGFEKWIIPKWEIHHNSTETIVNTVEWKNTIIPQETKNIPKQGDIHMDSHKEHK